MFYLVFVLLFLVDDTLGGGDFSCGALSHKQWGGIQPAMVEYMAPPLSLVIIQHTATVECSSQNSCAELVRNIQSDHIGNRDYWDIGPSFLVGGDGRVYEGSGWTHVGAHTLGYNRNSIAIAFIGNFSSKQPKSSATAAAQALIRCGVEKGHLTADYQLVAHRQLAAFESPGLAFYQKVKTWPHYQSDISKITH